MFDLELQGDALRAWLAREREAARQLRGTHWWQTRVQAGRCEYCSEEVGRKALTMDHRVPLARGGRSNKGNVVASCRPCNQKKGLATPVDQWLTERSAPSSS